MLEKKSGFTLIEILIVIGIISILATILVPAVMRARIFANDALAKNTLSVMSKASEIYVANKNGAYPEDVTSLTSAVPAYLNFNYCGQSIIGFSYECASNVGGYAYVATPVTQGLTGSTTFIITTGGILTPSNATGGSAGGAGGP